ncbi:hypothetical protein C8R46DRAFT_1350869 [Mycena filopes]|nr:hypothetical protein C8R46DRAFT_1350869 [Mycena filopes]
MSIKEQSLGFSSSSPYIMHPAFHLAKLSEFPSPILRRLATQAASGSISAMRNFATSMSQQPHVELLLPVLWANFDPAGIPHADALDARTPCPDTVRALQRALCANEILSVLNLKGALPGVYVELWPRVWAWMEVLEVYHPLLPKPIPAVALRTRFLDVIFDILHDPLANAVIHTTPNIYAFVALTWTGLALQHSSGSHRLRFQAISHFIMSSAWDPENVHEFVDGAGGAETLARLVVQHVEARAIPSSTSKQLGAMDTVWLARLFFFVQALRSAELQSALLAAGIVPVLTTTLISLSQADSKSPALPEALEDCLDLLSKFACVEPRYAYIPAALDAGLLRAIVLVAIMDAPGADVNPTLQHWLRFILPATTIYYPVLRAMKNAIKTAVRSSVKDSFEMTPIFKDWLTFCTFASDRTERFDEFTSPRHLSLQFCDNYNRTSNEPVTFNVALDAARLITVLPYVNAPRGKGAIVQSASNFNSIPARIRAHKTEILNDQILFVRANPYVRFCTVFAYALGRCRFAVVALEKLPAERRTAALELAGRTEASTSLHHVVIGHEQPVAFNYVLRSSNSMLEDGPLSDPQAAVLRSEIERAKAEISTASLHIAHFQDALERLLRHREEVETLVRTHTGALSTLRRFPNEILLEVFHQALAEGAATDQVPWVLSEVCSHWRPVMLAAPSLWGHFPLSLDGNRPLSTPMMSLQLERAHHARLSIDFGNSVSADALALFLPVASQWQDVEMLVTDFMSPELTGHIFPALKNLTLGGQTHMRLEPDIDRVGSLPVMTQLTLDMRPLVSTSANLYGATWRILFGILPQLNHGTLVTIVDSFQTSSLGQISSLARSLTFTNCGPDFLGNLLSALSAPALDTLIVQTYTPTPANEWFVDHVILLLSRSACPLTRFCYDGCLDEDDFARILESPHIHNVIDLDFPRAPLSPRSVAVLATLPSLRTLVVCGTPADGAALLAALTPHHPRVISHSEVELFESARRRFSVAKTPF